MWGGVGERERKDVFKVNVEFNFICMKCFMLYNFFLSLLLFIRCILSLSQAFFFFFLNNERLCVKQAVLCLIPGGDRIFLILYCLKKACERERENTSNVLCFF